MDIICHDMFMAQLCQCYTSNIRPCYDCNARIIFPRGKKNSFSKRGWQKEQRQRHYLPPGGMWMLKAVDKKANRSQTARHLNPLIPSAWSRPPTRTNFAAKTLQQVVEAGDLQKEIEWTQNRKKYLENSIRCWGTRAVILKGYEAFGQDLPSLQYRIMFGIWIQSKLSLTRLNHSKTLSPQARGG